MTTIPNIIHFCFGLREQTEPFLLVYYLAVMSAKIVNNPDKIYMYYHYEPFGPLWERLKPHIILEKVELPTMIRDKPITQTAHKSDFVRMEKLIECGGVYFDIDTISYRPYKDLLNNECVLAWEIFPTHICNAIMMSKPNSEFMTVWNSEYYNYFKSDGWGEASVRLPAILYHNHPSKVKVLEADYFFRPSHYEMEKLFIRTDVPIPKNAVTLHLWESMRMDIIKSIDLRWLLNNKDTLYSKFVFANRELLNCIPDFETVQFLENKKIFENIYNKGIWNNNNPAIPFSGPGSLIQNTAEFSTVLNEFIYKNGCTSVLDLGCGDLNWIPETPFFKDDNIKYTGVDVVESLITSHSSKYPIKTFLNKDITLYKDMEFASIIIIRDVIFHLKNYEILAIFENIKNKFKYLAITNCKNEVNSDNLNFYQFSYKNLHKEPFNKSHKFQVKVGDHPSNQSEYIYAHDDFYE